MKCERCGYESNSGCDWTTCPVCVNSEVQGAERFDPQTIRQLGVREPTPVEIRSMAEMQRFFELPWASEEKEKGMQTKDKQTHRAREWSLVSTPQGTVLEVETVEGQRFRFEQMEPTDSMEEAHVPVPSQDLMLEMVTVNGGIRALDSPEGSIAVRAGDWVRVWFKGRSRVGTTFMASKTESIPITQFVQYVLPFVQAQESKSKF